MFVKVLYGFCCSIRFKEIFRSFPHSGFVSKRRGKKKSPPVIGVAGGPDRKGRFYLPLEPSQKRLLFYGGLPGETVEVRRGRRGRRGEQGDLLQVIAPSHHRREAPCRHFGVCGGCTLQHLPEQEALRLKSEPHYQELKNFYPQAQLWPPVCSPGSFAYRSKVELTFLQQPDGTTTLGFHKRGKFDRGVDVGRCWLTPLKPGLLSDIREWMEKRGFKGWNPKTHEGNLRYLVYRYSFHSRNDLLALVVNQSSAPGQDDLDAFVRLLKSNGVGGALVVEQTSVAGAVVPEVVRPLYGAQTLIEKLGELEFELGWQSFFQVNPPAYERLLDTIRKWRITPPGGRVLDLFCGVGTIGLSLCGPKDRLTGVELVEQAVADARKNATRNGREANFEVRSAEDWADFDTDLLIIDPPRSGCHPKLVTLLSEKAPARELFYVSCNPFKLSEELPMLSRRYELIQACAFDFFPQTHHCELLLQFVRREDESTGGHADIQNG